MKAIICTKYGPADKLQLKEVAKPAPDSGEVLVKIKTTAINDWDWSLVRGKPFVYRLLFGLTKPKISIPGIELAGIIEEIGGDVTSFKAGDEVYGDTSEFGWGTFAEYACVREKSLVLKPSKMSFEEATCVSHASMLAWQGLVDTGGIEDGQKILINGAGGGVGTFALQIAKEFDVEVTGVDSGEKMEAMRSLGYDQVINYQKEDFTRNGQLYDLILDTKTTRTPFDYLRSLKPNGQYVTVGGHLDRLLQMMFFRGWISRFKKKSFNLVALKPNKDLDQINDLFEKGKIRPLIDGPYKLEEIPKLIQYFGEGKHKGKIVISI